MTKKHMPSYSGRKSTRIWNKINALPRKKAAQAYALGCIIQQTESLLFDILNASN